METALRVMSPPGLPRLNIEIWLPHPAVSMFVQGKYISFTAAGNLLTSPSLCQKLRVVVAYAVQHFIIGNSQYNSRYIINCK